MLELLKKTEAKILELEERLSKSNTFVQQATNAIDKLNHDKSLHQDDIRLVSGALEAFRSTAAEMKTVINGIGHLASAGLEVAGMPIASKVVEEVTHIVTETIDAASSTSEVSAQ